MPYGDKNDKEVINLTRQSVKFLMSKNVKLIIFACNTATAVAMTTLQKEFKPQIIGVIQSGSLAAVHATRNKKVAVMATPVTINSHAYKKEIQFRDPKIEVSELAAPKLAPLIEKQKDYSTNLAAVKESIKPLENKNFDTFVLGCTHYPIIEKEFAASLPKGVKIIDPADQVAQYTFNVMKRDSLFHDNSGKNYHQYYTTGDVNKFETMGRSVLGEKTLVAKPINIENL